MTLPPNPRHPVGPHSKKVVDEKENAVPKRQDNFTVTPSLPVEMPNASEEAVARAEEIAKTLMEKKREMLVDSKGMPRNNGDSTFTPYASRITIGDSYSIITDEHRTKIIASEQSYASLLVLEKLGHKSVNASKLARNTLLEDYKECFRNGDIQMIYPRLAERMVGRFEKFVSRHVKEFVPPPAPQHVTLGEARAEVFEKIEALAEDIMKTRKEAGTAGSFHLFDPNVDELNINDAAGNSLARVNVSPKQHSLIGDAELRLVKYMVRSAMGERIGGPKSVNDRNLQIAYKSIFTDEWGNTPHGTAEIISRETIGYKERFKDFVEAEIKKRGISQSAEQSPGR